MELEWKESIQIQDGSHTGTVSKVEFRTEPYEYTDVYVKLEGLDVELKYSCPTNLSENSKLGRLLQSFGIAPTPKTKIDPEKVLVGQKVQFMTLTKKTKEGKEFSEIVEDSVKPVVS